MHKGLRNVPEKRGSSVYVILNLEIREQTKAGRERETYAVYDLISQGISLYSGVQEKLGYSLITKLNCKDFRIKSSFLFSVDTFRHERLLPPRESSLWKDKDAVGSRSLAAWGTETSEGCSPRLADIMFHIFCGRRSTSFCRLAISPYFILVCNLKLLTFNLISIQQSLIKHPL